MDHFPGNWGQQKQMRDEHYLNDFTQIPKSAPISHTQQPIVTGTSVLGIKFKDGVMLAADTLASYGSLAQIRDMKRLAAVGDYTVIGAGGDMSDWQHIQHVLEAEIITEYYNDDGHTLFPEHIHEYLSRLLYNRRSKQDPLWNSLVVGGFNKGKKFLGYVDYQGTTYHSSTIATGYGSMIAQPLLRKAVEGNEDTLTEEEAIKILDDSMRVLFYRDARSLNKIQRATITASGSKITEPYSLATEWGFADSIRGYGAVYE
ncbi:nucleophile aminohydrolase [Globomyces pollinis-pini]|nr:nucleophile aminohydrolase [Globomyces pollinis-pini]